MVTIGVLYPGIIGAVTTFRWVSVACIAWSLVWSLCLLWLCPESPRYLLTLKDYDGARQALQFLRGHELVETELAQQVSFSLFLISTIYLLHMPNTCAFMLNFRFQALKMLQIKNFTSAN